MGVSLDSIMITPELFTFLLPSIGEDIQGYIVDVVLWDDSFRLHRERGRDSISGASLKSIMITVQIVDFFSRAVSE